MAYTPSPNLAAQDFFTTTLTNNVAATDTVINVANVPAGTEGYLVIDPNNPTTREIIYYNSKSSSTVTTPDATANSGRGIGGTSVQTHLSGTLVEQRMVAEYWNALQNGSSWAVGSIGATAFASGWAPGIPTPSSIVANGNRSYTLTLSGSTDYTSTLSNGMRLQLTRTVAAPTQCTSLNGTTQYYNKTSPTGMTFTNNFVVSAWVKLNSYKAAGQTIASRYNGTSGYAFQVNPSGQIGLVGYNAGAANFKYLLSYQSAPLNKWIHLTAQLDMSSSTNSPTVNYVMFDGVDVPAVQSQGGTNPVVLIQAGNLEIGGQNGGTIPLDGKIAQVAIYNAKVTQATILASMNQTLVGTETSLISAYSFNNSINDLNVNANNLTANGSAVATNADSPFAQGKTAGSLEYGIITANSFSTSTVLTVQVPEGSALPTTGGISAVSYSTQKVPYGFPGDRIKWKLETLLLTSQPVSIGFVNQWISSSGIFSLNVPIGSWVLGYQGNFRLNSTVSGVRSGHFTVSDSAPTNAVRNQPMTLWMYGDANTTDLVRHPNKSVPYAVSTATNNYVYGDITSASGTEIYRLDGDQGGCSLYVENAYL